MTSGSPEASSVSCSLRIGFGDDACLPIFADLFLGDPHRVAVEVRVGEEPRGRAGVVEDVEPELAVIVAHARAAPDDLLELAHGADDARQHDILAGRRINAGREQLRGREDDRRLAFPHPESGSRWPRPMSPSSAVTRQT